MSRETFLKKAPNSTDKPIETYREGTPALCLGIVFTIILGGALSYSAAHEWPEGGFSGAALLSIFLFSGAIASFLITLFFVRLLSRGGIAAAIYKDGLWMHQRLFIPWDKILKIEYEHPGGTPVFNIYFEKPPSFRHMPIGSMLVSLFVRRGQYIIIRPGPVRLIRSDGRKVKDEELAEALRTYLD